MRVLNGSEKKTNKLTNAIVRPLDILVEKTDSQAAMAQTVEHATGARKISGSSLGQSTLSNQNLGTCGSCERIGKKDCDDTSLRKCNYDFHSVSSRNSSRW